MQKAKPWWEFGGEAMCMDCVRKHVPDNEEVYGGYRIETDKPPLCAYCGCELDMTYIGDNPEFAEPTEQELTEQTIDKYGNQAF